MYQVVFGLLFVLLCSSPSSAPLFDRTTDRPFDPEVQVKERVDQRVTRISMRVLYIRVTDVKHRSLTAFDVPTRVYSDSD